MSATAPSEDGSALTRLLVRLPDKTVTRLVRLSVRIGSAVAIFLATSLLVWFDRAGYLDATARDGVTFLDALYFAAITLTATGYGDIIPVADHSRLINALVITPLRVAFLAVVVETTLNIMANEGRTALQDRKWRKQMRNHAVVIGYGTTGRAAVATLLGNGVGASKIVVIDLNPANIAEANRIGIAGFEGDGNSRELLRRAEVPKAKDIIICVNRDDSAILATLACRQLNPVARVVTSVRERDNAALVRQSGASAVVTSSDAVGRLMGMASVNPAVGDVIEDLLSYGEGLEVAQRLATSDEVGHSPADVEHERILGVVRHHTLRRFYDSTVQQLETGDELIVVRRAGGAPEPQARPRDVREASA